jgi:hypothetical protein
MGIRVYDTPGYNDTDGVTDEMIFTMFIEEICCRTISRRIDAIVIIQSITEDRYSCFKIIDRL